MNFGFYTGGANYGFGMGYNSPMASFGAYCDPGYNVGSYFGGFNSGWGGGSSFSLGDSSGLGFAFGAASMGFAVPGFLMPMAFTMAKFFSGWGGEGYVDAFDPYATRRHWNKFLRKTFEPDDKKKIERESERKTEPGEVADRAGKYYDAAWNGKGLKESSKYYRGLSDLTYKELTSESKPAEKKRFENKRKEEFLFGFARELTSRLKVDGKAAQKKYVEGLRTVYEKYKNKDMKEEDMLLALMNPHAESVDDVGAIIQKYKLPGRNTHTSSTNADMYEEFRSAVKEQFKSEWRDVVRRLYKRQIAKAKETDYWEGAELKKSTIVEWLKDDRKYTSEEAEAVFDHAFSELKTNAAAMALKPPVVERTGDKITSDGRSNFVRWYLEKIKRVADIDEINKVYKKVAKKSKSKGIFDIPKFMKAVDSYLGGAKGTKDGKKTGKKRGAGRPGTGKGATGKAEKWKKLPRNAQLAAIVVLGAKEAFMDGEIDFDEGKFQTKSGKKYFVMCRTLNERIRKINDREARKVKKSK